MANDVASKAEKDTKTQDIEAIIANIKAEILKNVGDKISSIVMAEVLRSYRKRDENALSPISTSGGNIAYQIAECAEIIMRRAWIDQK